MIFNFVLIAVLIIMVLIFLYVMFHNSDTYIEETVDNKVYSIEYLAAGIKAYFNGILKANVADLNLNKYETEKRERNKSKLRVAIRSCSHGNIGSKEFIKEHIKDILQKRLKINEETIDNVIPFNNPSILTKEEKFEILLHFYKKESGLDALTTLIECHKLDELRINSDEEKTYEILENDIHQIYDQERFNFSFSDKLDIVSQFVYMVHYGNSVIDSILDMHIDGVSGGVSGIPAGFYNYGDEILFSDENKPPSSYDSVFIFLKGKTIHLSFLSFGSQKELERVCKNIYNNGKVGQLSEREGYKVADLPNGSRVTVCRPPLSESWCFLVRNFDSIKIAEINELITETNATIPINVLKYIVSGQQVLAITGGQGSGKTTLTKALIKFINPTFNLRIHEQIFELALRKLYPNKNIITFRDIDTIPGQEVLNMLKKTDGNATLVGEVATAEQTNYVIQVAQIASDQTMFTSHHKTTPSLIRGMRNDLMKDGGFNNEKIAEEQVVSAINFDTHMEKSNDGHRYVQRITEIVPVNDTEYSENMKDAMREFFHRMTNKETYKAVDIVALEDGKYVLKNDLSKRAKNEIVKYLKPELVEEFNELFNGFKEVGEFNK